MTASPSVKAAQLGATAEVKLQIMGRVNIETQHNETARTALAVAAHCGRGNIVQLLLDNELMMQTLISMIPQP